MGLLSHDNTELDCDALVWKRDTGNKKKKIDLYRFFIFRKTYKIATCRLAVERQAKRVGAD